MDASPPKFLLLLLLSIPIVCCTSTSVKGIKLQENPKAVMKAADFAATTVANPATVTVSPGNSSPGIVTVTPTPPVTVSPATPTTNPSPAITPVTTTPATPTGGGAPPGATSAPSGQRWCVAKSGAPQTGIQAALDYACGIGGADCAAIQQGASCYNPNTLQNHASYAFNSYYQKNPVQTSCDFGGTAVLTNVNPSSGSCTYTTKSSSSTPPATTTTPPSSPTTTTPLSPPATTTPPSPTSTTTTPSSPTSTTTPPSTSSSTGTPPISSSSGPPASATLNGSNPVFGLGGATTGFGASPPTTDNSSISRAPTNLQPFISCIIVTFASVIAGGMIF